MVLDNIAMDGILDFSQYNPEARKIMLYMGYDLTDCQGLC